MVSVDEAAALAMAMPDAVEGERYGNRTWSVRGTAFAWVRPFSKADLRRFDGKTPPAGPILAVRVDDLMEKEAVLAAARRGVFTIPHFNGYPAVLLQLDVAARRTVRDAVVDGWLACAPRSLADDWLARRGGLPT